MGFVRCLREDAGGSNQVKSKLEGLGINSGRSYFFPQLLHLYFEFLPDECVRLPQIHIGFGGLE